MNPKRQVIEQAIMDLEENKETVRQIYEDWLNSGSETDYLNFAPHADAMHKARKERINIAVRIFSDYKDGSTLKPIVGDPNEQYYVQNPTPVFKVGDFGLSGPIITGYSTMSLDYAPRTIKRIDKFIDQLKMKLKRRKDLQESSPFQLTEAKLKQMILEALGQESEPVEGKGIMGAILAKHGFEPYKYKHMIKKPILHKTYNSRSWFKGNQDLRWTVQFTLTYNLINNGSILKYKIEALSKRQSKHGRLMSIASGEIEVTDIPSLETEENLEKADNIMLNSKNTFPSKDPNHKNLSIEDTIERALGMYK